MSALTGLADLCYAATYMDTVRGRDMRDMIIACLSYDRRTGCEEEEEPVEDESGEDEDGINHLYSELMAKKRTRRATG